MNKIAKVQALADRAGTEGERLAALAALERLTAQAADDEIERLLKEIGEIDEILFGCDSNGRPFLLKNGFRRVYRRQLKELQKALAIELRNKPKQVAKRPDILSAIGVGR